MFNLVDYRMIKVDNKQDLDIELNKTKSIVALFYANWCPYCMRFVPLFSKKATAFGARTIIHVIMDDYDNPLWDEYEISSVPTIILFEEGQVENRLDGRLGRGLSEDQFLKWVETLKQA